MTQTGLKKGTIEIICGPMFSGKSEELMRRLRRLKIARKTILVFKPSVDIRRGIDLVTSHNGNQMEAIPVDNPHLIIDHVSHEVDVVGIDEAQFFSHELINVVIELTDMGKQVIIAGLNLDFRAVPFGPMPVLMAIAENVTKLSAICMICGGDAFFSQRLVNGKPASYDDTLIKVGAEEAYQARCRNCYIIDKKAVWQSTL